MVICPGKVTTRPEGRYSAGYIAVKVSPQGSLTLSGTVSSYLNLAVFVPESQVTYVLPAEDPVPKILILSPASHINGILPPVSFPVETRV